MAISKHVFWKVIFAKLIFIFSVVFISTILFFSVNKTPFSIYNQHINFSIKAFIPEGWGFFTRDPQEEKFRVYEILDNCSLKELKFAVGSKENLYGLSRKIRKRNFEFSKILQYIPEKSWIDTKGERENLSVNCKSSPQLTLELDKKNFSILQSKKLLLYRYQIIPWEWSKLTEVEEGKKIYVFITFK